MSTADTPVRFHLQGQLSVLGSVITFRFSYHLQAVRAYLLNLSTMLQLSRHQRSCPLLLLLSALYHSLVFIRDQQCCLFPAFCRHMSSTILCVSPFTCHDISAHVASFSCCTSSIPPFSCYVFNSVYHPTFICHMSTMLSTTFQLMHIINNAVTFVL